MAAPRLPGGRGVYKGEDRYIASGEEYTNRARRIPSQYGHVISSITQTSGGYGISAASELTFEISLHTAVGDMHFSHAMMRVTSVGAGSGRSIIAALYVLTDKVGKWTQVNGSQATFSMEATGVLTANLPGIAVIPNGSWYGYAFLTSTTWSGSTTVATSAIGGNPIVRPFLNSNFASTKPPAHIDTTDTSWARTATSTYGVTYISPYMVGVF